MMQGTQYQLCVVHSNTTNTFLIYEGIPTQELQDLLFATFFPKLNGKVMGFVQNTPNQQEHVIPISFMCIYPQYFLKNSISQAQTFKMISLPGSFDSTIGPLAQGSQTFGSPFNLTGSSGQEYFHRRDTALNPSNSESGEYSIAPFNHNIYGLNKRQRNDAIPSNLKDSNIIPNSNASTGNFLVASNIESNGFHSSYYTTPTPLQLTTSSIQTTNDSTDNSADRLRKPDPRITDSDLDKTILMNPPLNPVTDKSKRSKLINSIDSSYSSTPSSSVASPSILVRSLEASAASTPTSQERSTTPIPTNNNTPQIPRQLSVQYPTNAMSASTAAVLKSSSSSSDEAPKSTWFTATELIIGTWEIKQATSRIFALFNNEEQTIAWQFHVTNEDKSTTKHKIQFKYSNLRSCNLYETHPNQIALDFTAVLESPPVFFKKLQQKEKGKENVGQISTNDHWLPCSDFTNSQASTCRRHRLKFMDKDAKGVELLFQNHKFLHGVSQNGKFSMFPTSDDLVFSSVRVSS